MIPNETVCPALFINQIDFISVIHIKGLIEINKGLDVDVCLNVSLV